MYVGMFVFNKRQNGWTDGTQFFYETSRGPGKGLWMIKFLQICFRQNSDFFKLLYILKIHEIFNEICELFCLFCFTKYKKENMFTIEIEDRREAPLKA